MDLGAIILDPFDARHLNELQEALCETCRRYEVAPERTRVAYSAHGELGPRIVVHIHPGGEDALHDPFLFLTNHHGFGPTLSGVLSDRLGEGAPTSTAWSVSRDRRTGFCSVARGSYFTAEAVDSAEDGRPIQRLASTLGVGAEVLSRSLERPVTEWMPVTSAPTPGALAEVQARLASAPRSDPTSRNEPAATFACALREELSREAQELSRTLGITLGELMTAAWEIAKAEVYGATPVYDQDFNEGPSMRAPEAHAVSQLDIPSSAPPLPERSASRARLEIAIAAPARVVEEIQALANAADRPPSWVLEKAYVAARARLHRAQRR